MKIFGDSQLGQLLAVVGFSALAVVSLVIGLMEDSKTSYFVAACAAGAAGTRVVFLRLKRRRDDTDSRS